MNSTPLLPRYLAPRLAEALADSSVVLLHGPRQSGKTNLAHQVGAAAGYGYVTFDDDTQRAAAESDPMGFVGDLPERVARLWRLMGLRATAPGPHTSRPHPKHKTYPYLLRDLTIERANQVWMMDITYIPMPRGFFYLAAILDVFSRRVLGWELSNSLAGGFCVDTLQQAIATHCAPEIMNTDQGSQFTSETYTLALLAVGVRISMDGKGRAIDNVFIERFWHSLKYEDINLRDYADGHALHAGIGHYIDWHNHCRSQRAHDGLAPDAIDCHIVLGSQPAVGGRYGFALRAAASGRTSCAPPTAAPPQPPAATP